MSPIDDEIEDSSAPLIEHLAELRTRLIRSVLAFIVGMVIVFSFGGQVLDFLLVPIEKAMRDLGNPNPTMQYTAPQEYFFTLIRVSMVGGFVLAFPVIATQLWRFVAPGLYKSEKQAFLPFLIASPALFLLGAAFAHYVVVPLAMNFFLGFADIPSLVANRFSGAGEAARDSGIDFAFQGKVNESLDITLKMIIAFGLCFQLPVLLTLMGKAGLATAAGLRGMRKYAVVGILTVAAIVTPPDVTTQVILFVVVYGLYEVSIFLVARVEKKREARLRAEGLWFEDDDDGGDDGGSGGSGGGGSSGGPDASPSGGPGDGGSPPKTGDPRGDPATDDDPIFGEFDDEEEADDAAHHGDGGTWEIAEDAEDGARGGSGPDAAGDDPGAVNKDG